MATSPPPPPPSPDEVWKLTGFRKDAPELDLTKPVIGISENSDYGVFIYTVDKADIYKSLCDVNFKPKENEMYIVRDSIILDLIEKLKQEQLAEIYPYRGIFIHYNAKREEQKQEVAVTLAEKAEPGIYQFIVCSNCKRIVCINNKFPNMLFITDDDDCSGCGNTEGL